MRSSLCQHFYPSRFFLCLLSGTQFPCATTRQVSRQPDGARASQAPKPGAGCACMRACSQSSPFLFPLWRERAISAAHLRLRTYTATRPRQCCFYSTRCLGGAQHSSLLRAMKEFLSGIVDSQPPSCLSLASSAHHQVPLLHGDAAAERGVRITRCGLVHSACCRRCVFQHFYTSFSHASLHRCNKSGSTSCHT